MSSPLDCTLHTSGCSALVCLRSQPHCRIRCVLAVPCRLSCQHWSQHGAPLPQAVLSHALYQPTAMAAFMSYLYEGRVPLSRDTAVPLYVAAA